MDFDQAIKRLIDTALQEDLGASGDITTLALLNESTVISGKLILREKGVLAGLPYLEYLFKKIDPKITVELRVDEGSYQTAGTVLAKITGPARAIIAGERTALNFLQHASGVATIYAQYVRKVRGLKCEILDTRKTLPGLRALEQYAIRVGGGVNHRLGLNHRFLIKRNHLAFFAMESSRPIQDAVKRVRAYLPEIPVEVEVGDFEQLKEALLTDCESLMLYNMSQEEISRALKMIRKTNKKAYFEGRSSVTLETIRMFAETGIDGIATSASYFAKPTDIRLRIMI
ncbi:MAG: carboxylating nicotinate-nucleotide diphosphorylase [Chlamydiia bacterium]|nr:carboxylating nicotinate-nucleotide diphosphorylase [Chlamydiia bacterium]